jgi:hypothetical protein
MDLFSLPRTLSSSLLYAAERGAASSPACALSLRDFNGTPGPARSCSVHLPWTPIGVGAAFVNSTFALALCIAAACCSLRHLLSRTVGSGVSSALRRLFSLPYGRDANASAHGFTASFSACIFAEHAVLLFIRIFMEGKEATRIACLYLLSGGSTLLAGVNGAATACRLLRSHAAPPGLVLLSRPALFRRARGEGKRLEKEGRGGNACFASAVSSGGRR